MFQIRRVGVRVIILNRLVEVEIEVIRNIRLEVKQLLNARKIVFLSHDAPLQARSVSSEPVPKHLWYSEPLLDAPRPLLVLPNGILACILPRGMRLCSLLRDNKMPAHSPPFSVHFLLSLICAEKTRDSPLIRKITERLASLSLSFHRKHIHKPGWCTKPLSARIPRK